MLVAQLYLQMKDLFAIAYKTKMPRFNDTGMYGANPYFMQFFTFDTKKWIISDPDLFMEPVKREADWFKPGMVFISYSKIFVYFPFEFFEYKIVFGERWQFQFSIHYS